MKITLQMLLTRLHEIHPDFAVPAFPDTNEIHIKGIRLYSPETVFPGEDYLYVCEETDDPSGQLAERPPFLLPVPKMRSQAAVFNDLQQIYADFQDWDRHMHECLIRTGSLEELLHESRIILDNPILVYDLGLKLLGYDKPDDFSDQLLEQTVAEGYLPAPIMLLFDNLGVFDNKKITSPQLIEPFHASDLRTMYQPVYTKGTIAGYLVLPLYHEHGESYDRILFENLYESVSLCMEQMLRNQNTAGFMYEYALADLLNNPGLPRETIQNRLQYVGVPYQSGFYLITLATDRSNPSTRPYLLQWMHQSLSHARVFEYREQLLILIFGNPQIDWLLYKTKIPQLYASIPKTILDYSIPASCSLPFYEITGILEAERMNQEMLLYQSEFLPGENRLFFFEDYMVKLMTMQVLTKTSYHPSLPPALQQMLEEDQKKNTQYVLLLRTYLEECCRVTETAQKLNMHRNNVIYHIHRIEARYHLDLSDPDERLKLLLSFQLLEQMQARSET